MNSKSTLIGLLMLTGLPPLALAQDGGPTLQAIMQQLGQHMQRGADAIAREDWPAVARIAPAIAEHPQPTAAEKVRILTALGTDASRFREHDQLTHQAADELGRAAGLSDGPAVIAAYAKVQTACLGCHQGFRARVRNALGAR